MLSDYSKKTYLALLNPYKTVKQVFPLAIDQVEEKLALFKACNYIGVKNVSHITKDLITKLEEDCFVLHTIDNYALGGRAIDFNLTNPLTCKYMTGSSSGTALNVFYHINDLGIGTDGGGSVLAPAASINLYGFISPKILEERMKQYQKVSTDNISFTPSIGFITRDFVTIKKAILKVLEVGEIDNYKIKVQEKDKHYLDEFNLAYDVIKDIDVYGPRESLFNFVRENLTDHDLLVSYEKRVDVEGIGDSVFGLFDSYTSEVQKSASKGLIRVVNMLNKQAIFIPSNELASGILIITNDDKVSLANLLDLASKITYPKNKLSDSYFANLDNYFKTGFNF